MVSNCPSLLQVTEVAGEPVEVQVRVKDELDVSRKVIDAILGRAEERKINDEIQVTVP